MALLNQKQWVVGIKSRSWSTKVLSMLYFMHGCLKNVWGDLQLGFQAQNYSDRARESLARSNITLEPDV